jgi:hypothetical protein
LSMVSKLHGKELSFNNLLDLDSGRLLIEDFELPAAAIIKHNNPCGVAVGAGLGDAFDKALATDPQSAFGGVFCFNRPVDRALAEKQRRVGRCVGAEGREATRAQALALGVRVELLEERKRVLDAPAGRGGEQLLLGKCEEAGRPALAAAEQPGDARREVSDQECSPQTGCAGVDHAAIRSQLSSL